MAILHAVSVDGVVATGFEAVAEAFRANFASPAEVGAAVSVFYRGRPVVDLWGGIADTATGRPWREDTMALVFSATKGITALCVHRLVERRVLDLDAPVARYWPEFGQAGKDHIPLRWVLSHRTGIAAVDATLTSEQALAWTPVVDAIAAQPPAWEPNTAHGYHVRTFGWILGEVVRRVTGRTVGQLVADEMATPLGLDFYIGLPEALERRVATTYTAPPPADPAHREALARFMGPDTLLGRALTGPGDLAYGPVWNTRPMHATELPSSNGIGTARSLARLYAGMIGAIDGPPLLKADTLAQATTVASDGPDRVLVLPTRFGLGFMLPPALSAACAPSAFGHPGAGGALAFADPARELAFAYVMNQMQLGLVDDARARALVAAAYGAIDRP